MNSQVCWKPIKAFDGVELWTWAVGDPDAEPLLLIAGGGADGRTWSFVVPEIAAEPGLRGDEGSLAAHARVAGYDQRGTGRSGGATPPSSSALAAKDAHSVGAALFGERFHVAGLSLGGMAAQELAITQPEAVATLTLIATSAGGPGLTMPDDAFVANVTSSDADPVARARENVALGLSEEFAAGRPELVERLVARSLDRPTSLESWAAQAVHFATHDSTAALHDVTAPTLVVCGDEDRVVPVANSRYLAESIPGARLEVYPHVGHAVDVEQPGRLVGDLVAHLHRTRSASERPIEEAGRV